MKVDIKFDTQTNENPQSVLSELEMMFHNIISQVKAHWACTGTITLPAFSLEEQVVGEMNFENEPDWHKAYKSKP